MSEINATPQAITNRLWITNWSIWARVIFALVLVVIIPLSVTFVLIQQEVDAVDLRNLEGYVRDLGEDHQEDVTGLFERARIELAFLATSPGYIPVVQRIVRFQGQLSADDAIFTSYVNTQLIDQRLFSDVRLLTPQGIVVAISDVRRTDTPAAPLGQDDSETAAYQEIQTALTLQETQRIRVSVDAATGAPVVQLVQIIYNISNEPLGFLVGTLDNTTLLDLLDNGDRTFGVDVRAYLVTVNDEIIISENLRDEVSLSLTTNPVSRALEGREGVVVYAQNQRDYIAYYAPVTADNTFALVMETPADTSFTLTLNDVFESGTFVVMGTIIFAFLVGALLTTSITAPLRSLNKDIAALDQGDFTRPIVTARRSDEIGTVARSFANTRQQVRSLVDELEQRLQSRARDMQSTQAVSRYAATQRDLQTLMDQVVTLVVDRFPNIYHAQIFLVDANREYAVLRASTGAAGQQLLQRGHRLEVGGVSVIGQVTEEARVVVARDTSDSEIHRRNEFLLETRAELAIPLRIGQVVMGALDVQSKQSDSFTDEQVRILQTMADQIAIAIENARLYQESVQRLREIDLNNQQATLRNWRQHMNTRRQREIVMGAGTTTPVDMSPLRQAAMQQGNAVIGAITERDTIPFAVPIQLRKQTLGAVEWEVPSGEFSDERVQLAQELVSRLAVTLDNARLFQESQQAINRERLVNEIAARLAGQTDIDAILKTAVRDVGLALRAPQVSIKLNMGQDAETANGTHAENGTANGSSSDLQPESGEQD